MSATGRFVWYELLTDDPEGAKAFYGEVMGLGTEPWTGDDKPYAMFRHSDDAENAPTGGMSDMCEEMGIPPMWLYYVGVDGIDGALARTRQHGGAVLNGPMEVPGGGFAAQCRDPQGAMFALFSMTR